MDLKMTAEEISTTADVSWDCAVENGLVPLLMDDEEDIQCATIAAFLIQGTVPQLPDVGVPWSKYLTQEITFGELDFYVRDSLQKAEKDTYYPQYNIENETLTMTVGQLDEEKDYSEL